MEAKAKARAKAKAKAKDYRRGAEGRRESQRKAKSISNLKFEIEGNSNVNGNVKGKT